VIRLTVPSIEEDDLQAVARVLASGFLVQGDHVAAFERAVAAYVGCEHAVAVSSGTAALHLALLALDTRPGDLVIVPAYSFNATANVVEICGAQPVFVDIQPDSFNIDPSALETVLKRLMSVQSIATRVKAILPVHTFGRIADMPAVCEIAERFGIPLVEDAACALGAVKDGKQAGAWGVMGCFSFHPRKAITTGEGGMITTNNPDLAARLRALRNHGLDPNSPAPDFILPGLNYRITDFQGAFGVTQMAKLDRIITSRRCLAERYQKLLADSPFQLPLLSNPRESVYQSYVILLPENLVQHRQAMIAELKGEGIESTIGTWHMPMTTYFRNRYSYRHGDFPITDQVFLRALTLPLYESMTGTQQSEIAHQLLVKHAYPSPYHRSP